MFSQGRWLKQIMLARLSSDPELLSDCWPGDGERDESELLLLDVGLDDRPLAFAFALALAKSGLRPCSLS